MISVLLWIALIQPHGFDWTSNQWTREPALIQRVVVTKAGHIRGGFLYTYEGKCITRYVEMMPHVIAETLYTCLPEPKELHQDAPADYDPILMESK